MPLPLVPIAGVIVVGLAKWLADKLATALTLAGIIGGIVWALSKYWCLLLWQLINMSIVFSNWMEDYVPEALTLALGGLSTWIPIANYWFPIGEYFTLLAAFWTFSFALIAYRVIKSWIPSVSG